VRFCVENLVRRHPNKITFLKVSVWEIVTHHLEVTTTRGILLIVLVFALTCSLVVAFISFIRSKKDK
jgi:hypothetical protein